MRRRVTVGYLFNSLCQNRSLYFTQNIQECWNDYKNQCAMWSGKWKESRALVVVRRVAAWVNKKVPCVAARTYTVHSVNWYSSMPIPSLQSWNPTVGILTPLEEVPI